MSDFQLNDQTGNELFVTYDLSKIFLWNNEYNLEPVNNSTYAVETYVPGTAMGRVSSTGLLVPFTSGANDGSQYPIGILNRGIVLQAGDVRNVNICISGGVAAEMIVLSGSDTLDTTVANAGGRRVRDLIASQSAGIQIITSENLTFGDNV